jgi:tetratricopeptide (TPR) repeat protein
VADFSEAIRISPFALQAYENRGDVYTKQKKHELARADYSAIIDRTLALASRGGADVRPGAKLAVIYRKRSAVLLALNKPDDALADVNESIGLDDTDPEAFTLRQQLRLKKGQTAEAVADGKRAAQLSLKQLSGTK